MKISEEWPRLSVAAAMAQLAAPGAMFEMEEVVVRGQPLRSYTQALRTLREVFDRGCRWGDRPFLLYEGETQSYAEHFRAAGALGRVLQHRYGVAAGDRVAIAARNLPEWSLAFWAAAAIGAVITPLNAWSYGPDLVHAIGDSGATMVFVDEERLQRLADHLEEIADCRVVLLRGETTLVPMLHELIGPRCDYGRLPAEPPADPGIDTDDAATIFYTSGTTGRAKGAIGTHRNLLTNLISSQFHLHFSALRAGTAPPVMAADAPQRVNLLPVPLFHVTGCHGSLVPSVATGARLILMHKWDVGRFFDLVERERVNAAAAVPSMVWQVLDAPDLATRDLSSLISFGYGGGPASPDLVARFAQALPWITPRQGYGSTETSSLSIVNGGRDYRERPRSIGLPVPVVDLRVERGDGGEAAIGEAGELLVRGPNVVAGYWNQPEASKEAFGDGWYRTGDIVRRDAEGFVTLLDRAKDMVIRGGENIYCVEIENLLLTHGDVIDAAVIGLPHRTLGEEVAAVVQLRPGAMVGETDLQHFARAALAPHKVPVRIAFRLDPLPKNAAGKTVKSTLREEMLAGQDMQA